MRRADPYVCKIGGEYYFTASVPEYDRIILRKSQKLDELADTPETVIWKKHERGIMSKHIWAPELHYLQGKWYVYYAGGDVDDPWAIRPYVLECTGEDPLKDTWMECGMVVPADEFSFNDFSLDMTVFENQGDLYCVWAEKVNIGKKISNLYIAKMKNPLELSSQQVLLTTPDYTWERRGFWVNEGPAILKHKNKLYLTYSASETGIDYCVGMLSIDARTNLLDPRQWKKEKTPVLKTDFEKGILGPGHNSFVKDEEEHDIMFYHARQYDEIIGDPLYDPDRHTFRMKVEWNENLPIFKISNNF